MLPIKPVINWPNWVLDSTPVIPKFYWDVYSQEQRIHKICELLHKLVNYADYLGENINLDHELIDELQQEFVNFKESGFLDYYQKQLEQWITDNADWLFEQFAKMVFFGLTSDGYFCAYVPESWSDIQFDTGANYGEFDYGRLILRYNVDGATGVIDNTGRYDDGNYQQQLIDLERRIATNERTLYTLLQDG